MSDGNGKAVKEKSKATKSAVAKPAVVTNPMPKTDPGNGFIGWVEVNEIWRPYMIVKGYKVTTVDDTISGNIERECPNGKVHDPHEWQSGVLNDFCWCYGTGVMAKFMPASGSTTTTYLKAKTDYSTGWRKDYTVPLTVEEARAIAYDMHKNDKDKAGEPYYLHLEAVCLGVVVLGGDVEEQIAALFHDAYEDDHCTLKMLRTIGCTERTMDMIEAVSKEYNEDQKVYKQRILDSSRRTDGGTARVKAADLLHNTRHDRSAALKKNNPLVWKRHQKKYPPFLAALLMELGLIMDTEEQTKIATTPTGTAGGTTYYGSADGSTKFKGDGLYPGDWPATWPAPVEKKKDGYKNVYILTDGTEKITHADKEYRLWTKSSWTQKQVKDKDWTPSKEPSVAKAKSTAPTTGGTTTLAKGTEKGKMYDVDQLFRGDWVVFWKAPVLTMLSRTEERIVYLLANGEIKNEELRWTKNSTPRQVKVWTQHQWENDKDITPGGVDEEQILDYLQAVNVIFTEPETDSGITVTMEDMPDEQMCAKKTPHAAHWVAPDQLDQTQDFHCPGLPNGGVEKQNGKGPILPAGWDQLTATEKYEWANNHLIPNPILKPGKSDVGGREFVAGPNGQLTLVRDSDDCEDEPEGYVWACGDVREHAPHVWKGERRCPGIPGDELVSHCKLDTGVHEPHLYECTDAGGKRTMECPGVTDEEADDIADVLAHYDAQFSGKARIECTRDDYHEQHWVKDEESDIEASVYCPGVELPETLDFHGWSGL